MSHGQPQEEAEHASHHSHNPFDRRVAMTMVVIAAVLAAVKLLGHRSHNEAIMAKQQASNQWAYYQAKKIRTYTYEMGLKLPVLLNTGQTNKKVAAGHDDGPLPFDLFVAAEIDKKKPKPLEEDAKTSAELAKSWQKKIKKWEQEAGEIQKKAQDFEKEVIHAHHQSDRFDMGELFIELGLVFSSVAILTKRAMFWYVGAGGAVFGLVIALTGFFVH
jgi:hypothetical protein